MSEVAEANNVHIPLIIMDK